MRSISPVLFCGLLWFASITPEGESSPLAPPKSEDLPPSSPYAEIRVVDAETGRGVPLVELISVNHLRAVTDNFGRVAFNEPEMMNREVFFNIRSHGYEVKKDGFGFAGAKVVPTPGKISEIRIARRNLAERLCRLTGEGRDRDTLLLGYKAIDIGKNPGSVAGQDSVQAVPYKGKIYWFWGDTTRISYPLGLYRTAGATTPLPPFDFTATPGFSFDYFVDRSGFCRAMMPLPERPEGVIWIDGVCVVPDEALAERMIAHYSRRKNLQVELEHGIAVFDDEKKIFLPVKELPLSEKWRFPQGHSEIVSVNGKKWLYSGLPALNVRVPATLKDVLDARSYDAFTCASTIEKGKPTSLQQNEGKPHWRWQLELPPMGSEGEAAQVKLGKIAAADCRFYPANRLDPTERVRLHSGTIRWNEYRKKWLLVAGQIGGNSSHLGEVWAAESESPDGPFAEAVKVVTHDRQSFYNVCHHAFLDREGGRIIHFEGTYTSDFSGNTDKTPRYEYNQILYRLDLDKVFTPPGS